MHFLLNGKRWRLLREVIRQKTPDGRRVNGLCSPPDVKGRWVKVDSRLEGEEELDALIHETLHAAAWEQLDENFVEHTAEGIARLLWRLGYRKIGEAAGQL